MAPIPLKCSKVYHEKYFNLGKAVSNVTVLSLEKGKISKKYFG
jgi:hypothetical protein